MKKLIIAAALLAGTAFAAQAASAENPYCKMASSQRNPIAWGEYYGCIKAPTRTAAVVKHKPVRTASAKSPFCAMASAQRNVVAWNAYYHCLNR
jgi:opacity protein-like surface antigen